MLERVLEAEVMDSAADAAEYDGMDHSQVNTLFVADFLATLRRYATAEHATAELRGQQEVLDVGTGTAQIPLVLCRVDPQLRMRGIDLAASMLQLAAENVRRAGFDGRIQLQLCDAKRLPFGDGHFAAVMSNSIVHHIPEPAALVAEIVRVTAPRGLIFVRDLARPEDEVQLDHLVANYAAGATPRARQLFADSLRAALTAAEMQILVTSCGGTAGDVQMSSDRHWTWCGRRAGVSASYGKS